MSSENSPASPKTIALRLGLDVKELDKSCDEFLLPFLANFVHPWREVFAYLLAPIDLDDIDTENTGRSEQTKRLAGLRKWKVKCGAKATYGVLIASLLKNGDVQNAENICLQIMNSGNKVECTLSGLESTDSSLESQERKEVGDQIKKLDKSFTDLKKRLLTEMKANADITTETLLESLTWSLPLELQTVYKPYLDEKLPTLEKLGTIREICSRLGLFFTFLDYHLLQYLVEEFGSEPLKQDMSAYAGEIQVFLNETTVQQVKDHLPGRHKLPPNFEKLQMVIEQNPGSYSLRRLDNLRKQFCSETQLSEIVFVLIGIGKANSFLVVFMVPSILGPRLMESVGRIDDCFYQRECIISISLNQQQLYLSVALRERKMELEQRLLELCIDNAGDIQEFSYILSQPGVDPNIYDQNGWTPLCHISCDGRTEMAELLLNYGAKVDLPTKDEFAASPLILASKEGHVDTCAILIERGATVDYQNKEGGTALYMASQHGHKEVVELLLDRGASVDKPNMDGGYTALRIASVKGHTEVAGVLIARGAAVDYQDKEGATALYMASQYGHKAVVELLLDRGASVDKANMEGGYTALRVACAFGQAEVAGVLIARGAAVDYQDKDKSTPLTMASEIGHEDVCQMLIQHGAEVNHQHKDGWSPLHYASGHGQPSIVELLIKSGAQLDIQTKDGMTALAWAAYQGHKQIVHILLNAEANPDIQDQESMTALMLATQRGHKDIIKALVERKANPNITDETAGRSALFFTAEEGKVEIAKILVGGGADVDLKDKNDLTPLDTAKLHDQKDVYKFLQKHSRSEARKDITEEQKQRAMTFTKRLRKVINNLEWIFLRGRVLKQVEQASREFPSPGTTEQGKLGKIRKMKVVTSEPQSVGRSLVD